MWVMKKEARIFLGFWHEQLSRRSWPNCELGSPAGEAGLAHGGVWGGGESNKSKP